MLLVLLRQTTLRISSDAIDQSLNYKVPPSGPKNRGLCRQVICIWRSSLTQVCLYFILQRCTTQISSPNFFLPYPSQNRYAFTHSEGVFSSKQGELIKFLGFAGHMKSFRGPHLALGPYVVHVCFRSSIKAKSILK